MRIGRTISTLHYWVDFSEKMHKQLNICQQAVSWTSKGLMRYTKKDWLKKKKA